MAIERRTSGTPGPVSINPPGGPPGLVTLTPQGQGRYTGEVNTRQVGLFRAAADGLSAFAIAGIANPVEARKLVADPSAVAAATGSAGGVAFVNRNGRGRLPEVRDLGALGAQSGDGWIGLRRSSASLATASMGTPVVPGWAFALLIALASLVAWWREGLSNGRA